MIAREKKKKKLKGDNGRLRKSLSMNRADCLAEER